MVNHTRIHSWWYFRVNPWATSSYQTQGQDTKDIFIVSLATVERKVGGGVDKVLPVTGGVKV